MNATGEAPAVMLEAVMLVVVLVAVAGILVIGLVAAIRKARPARRTPRTPRRAGRSPPALQRAPRPLALTLTVKGGIWLAVGVGVVVGIMKAASCYRCDEMDVLIEAVGVGILAALLAVVGLGVVATLGWGLWRGAGVVATNPHAAIFAVFIVVILVLAEMLVVVLV